MQPTKSWRLKKTLARQLDFRPLEKDDLAYVWAAYRSGALAEVFSQSLTAEEFRGEFEALVLGRYDAAWTLFAETKKGLIPVGMMLGFWPHRDSQAFMIADTFIWFPWASPRNKIESAVNFINTIKSEIPMLGFAREHDKDFMVTIAKHGVLRRVGTSMNVFGDGPASVWETK